MPEPTHAVVTTYQSSSEYGKKAKIWHSLSRCAAEHGTATIDSSSSRSTPERDEGHRGRILLRAVCGRSKSLVQIVPVVYSALPSTTTGLFTKGLGPALVILKISWS
jgi:hypothetical protein